MIQWWICSTRQSHRAGYHEKHAQVNSRLVRIQLIRNSLLRRGRLPALVSDLVNALLVALREKWRGNGRSATWPSGLSMATTGQLLDAEMFQRMHNSICSGENSTTCSPLITEGYRRDAAATAAKVAL